LGFIARNNLETQYQLYRERGFVKFLISAFSLETSTQLLHFLVT